MTKLDQNLENEKSVYKREPLRLFRQVFNSQKSAYLDKRIKMLEKKISDNEDIGVKISNHIEDLIYECQILRDITNSIEVSKEKRKAENELRELELYIMEKYTGLENRHRTLIRLKKKLDSLKTKSNKEII